MKAIWWVAWAGIAGCVGCASPGVPRPPSLQLPEVAKTLSAERVGDEVALRWVTPGETTDGQAIRGPITAVICREAAAESAGCVAVDRREVKPGTSEITERLTGRMAVDPAQAVGFRVELQNAKARSAGKTAAVYVAGGAAPGPVNGLQVSGSRAGAVVQWQAAAGGAPVEVRRELLSGAALPVAIAQKPFGGSKQETVRMLRAGNEDAGGMVDSTVMRGAQYRYTAQRVREVTVGGRELVVRGPVSGAIPWEFKDVFPPAVPQGLVAVPGPGSIDLSWDAGSEADLAGYFVYRRAGDGPEQRLNAVPVIGPAYRDKAAVPGTTYTYRVTAVDAQGNESGRSGAVQEMVRGV